jgi:hypothetical protein
MNPIGPVWRFTVCDTDGLQTTVSLGPVERAGQDLSASLTMAITLPMPDQDERLPEAIEAAVHTAALEAQRQLFCALIEKADRELVLGGRDGKGGEGVQRRGTRPFTFKTIFGSVTVQRCRIRHNQDGSTEVPSASAWGTPHQLAITGNLRDAVCDQMGEHSAGASLEEIGARAGEPDLLGRSTVIDIVHEQGGRLIAAQWERARAVLALASGAELEALGPCPAADPEHLPEYEPDDAPAMDPEDPQWEQGPPEWVLTGFPGGDPAPAPGPEPEPEPEPEPKPPPASPDEPRAVDEGVVIVEPDEVKTKAQPSTGRKEVWTYTAVVLAAGLRYALADATTEGLWLQVAALLLEWDVPSGRRHLLVLGDGASWIRTWFEGLGIDPKAMIVCWWHLQKRCSENLSAAGGPKDRRRSLQKALSDLLWEGKTDAAIALLREAIGWVRNPKALSDLINYLEKRRAYIPDYGARRREGLWIASTRVEKFNDWAVSGRCKHQGMSWSEEGVLALAALEAARENNELDAWRRDGVLPERDLPKPLCKAG